MKVSGSILLDKRGAFPCVQKHYIGCAVYDFASMVKEADACKDTLYYDSDEWEEFYAYGYDPKNDYWNGLGSRDFQLLFNISNPVFSPIPVGEIDNWTTKPMPRTLGGFKCDECPSSDYIYDKQTIEDWHKEWFKSHPEKIDWSNSPNKVLPEYKRTIDILRESLYEVQNRPETIKGLTHPELLELKSLKIYELSPESVVSLFYKLIMNHKNATEEKIAYTKEIGKKICAVNYYKQEDELKRLETDHGNKCVEMVFSIKLDGKYQFLSVDKRHGTFELCNDDGTHLGEVTFDGSFSKKPDGDHSLKCVAEWRKNFNK